MVLPWPTVVSHPYAGSGTTAQWSCPDLQSCLTPTQALVLQPSGVALTYSRVSPQRGLWYYSPVVLPWPTAVSHPYAGSGTTGQWSCPDLESCLTHTQALVLQPSGLALTYSRVSPLRRLWHYSPVVLPWPTVVSHPFTGSGTTTQWSCPDLQSCLTPTRAVVLQPSGLALTYSRVSHPTQALVLQPSGLALTHSLVSPIRRLWYYKPVVLPWPTVVSHPYTGSGTTAQWSCLWPTVVSHPYAGSGTTAQWSCPDLQSCPTPTQALVLQPSGLALTYSRVSPLRRLWHYSPVVLPWHTAVSHPYTGSGTTAQWSCSDLQSCLTPTQALVLQPSGSCPDLQSCPTPTQALVLQPSGVAVTYSRVSPLCRLWHYSPVVLPSPTVVSHPIRRLWYYSPVVLPWPTVVSQPYAGSGTTAQWSCPDIQPCLTPTQALVLQPSGLALTYSRVSPLRRLWYYVVQPSGLALTYSCVSPLRRLWYYSPVVLPWTTAGSHPYAGSGTM